MPCIVEALIRRDDAVSKPMRMLFFSADDMEVQEVSREFAQAGIPCEVRSQSSRRSRTAPPEKELWIRNDRDCHRALLLCVQRNIGFARRPIRDTDPDEELQLNC